MKRTITACVGNLILFTLSGLAFAFPASELTRMEAPHFVGLEVNITIFPILFIAYLIAYPIIYYVFAKKLPWGKRTYSELLYSDEREKVIVAESTKVAYKALITGLFSAIAILFGIRYLSLLADVMINMYVVSILLLAALLNVAMISYCVKWCLEYRK